MLTTVNNGDGFAKLVFLSDDTLAAVINNEAAKFGYPRVASPMTLGGYQYPILQDLAEGNMYAICSSPLPITRVEQQAYVRLRDDPDTIYAYVDGSNVNYVQISNPSGASQRLSNAGWEIDWVEGGKTAKRVKTLNRPFRWFTRLDRPLNVHIVPDDGYTDLADDPAWEGFDFEILLDGAFIINARLVDQCRENIVFPGTTPDGSKTIDGDWLRQEHYQRKAMDFVSFNARLHGPMNFFGLEDGQEEPTGGLKGEAYKRYDMGCFGDDADIICTRSAFKKEVRNRKRTYVLIEPQVAKPASGEVQVFSDLQTTSNLPALFSPDQLCKWLETWVFEMFETLKSGKLLSSWYDQTNPVFMDGNYMSPNDVNTLVKWNARAWAMSGLNYSDSPWMFSHLARLMRDSLRADDEKSIRFPIPAALRCLVISQSLAELYGCDITVEPGDIRFCNDMEALVVNDADWIEMLPSHGGCDLDDFFNAYYRTIDDRKVVVITRSPNDWGEYSVFNYVDGDYFPYWTLLSGEHVMFPEVSSDPDLWPERLSEAQRRDAIVYSLLPSQRPGAKDHFSDQVQPYSPRAVDWQVLNSSSHASSVGQNVNARVLWSLTLAPTKGHRPNQLCTLENAVDAGTQGGLADDVDAVVAESSAIVHDIVFGSDCRVDTFLWLSRFQTFYSSLPPDRLDSNGPLTKLYSLRHQYAAMFMQMCNKYANDFCRPDPIVHTLGMRLLEDARKLLTICRNRMVLMQPPGQQSLEPEHWREVHAPIIKYLEACPTEAWRHDFLISLWSVSLKTPTSANKYTDQIVMNPELFPLLLDALRFYGLANYLNLDEEGHLLTSKTDSWTLICAMCEREDVTDNPHGYQKYLTANKICLTCRHA